MKLFNRDLLPLFIGILIITLLSSWLYYDFTARLSAGDAEPIGTITFKRKIAQRKYAEQVIWEEIEQQSMIYNYDTIRTADLSDAVIKLKDGTEISISENSMILLAMTENRLDIDFTRGSIAAKRDNIEGDSQLNIRSGDTTVSLGKSDVKLSGSEGEDLNLTVNKGNAKIKSGDIEKDVSENQKVVVSKESNDLTVFTFPIKLKTPAVESYIVTTSQKENVLFSWEPLEPFQQGRLEVADSESFVKKIITGKIAGESMSYQVPPGTHFWRVRAYNTKTGREEFSDTRRLVIVKENPVYLISPAEAERILYIKDRPIVYFKWGRSSNVMKYTLAVAEDPAFSSGVKKYETEKNSIALDTLDKGKYYWKVTATVKVGERSYAIGSDPRGFSIELRGNIVAPVPVSPERNSKVSNIVIKSKGVVFSWKNDVEITRTKIEIASDKSFNKMIHTSTVDTNFEKVVMDIPDGTYYWRLTGLIGDSSQTGTSDVRGFTVGDPQPILLKTPVNNKEIFTNIGRNAAIPFTWGKSDVFGNYTIQVSQDPRFARVFRDYTTRNNYATIANIGAGEYYWRVLLKGSDDSLLMKSPEYRFVVRDAIPMPALVAPSKNEVIDMTDRKNLLFEWRKVQNADRFRLKLYKKIDADSELILEKEIQGTSYRLEDISLLEQGDFVWSLQALKINELTGKPTQESESAEALFSIKLENRLEKPKLISPNTLYLEEKKLKKPEIITPRTIYLD